MFISVYMVKESFENGDITYSQDSTIVETLEEVDEAIAEIQEALDEAGKEEKCQLKITKVETYNLSKLRPSATKEF